MEVLLLPYLYAINCVADVELSVMARKRCKMSDITEMHLIAGAVKRTTNRVAYVHLFCGCVGWRIIDYGYFLSLVH